MRAIALFGFMVATTLFLLCILKVATEGVLFGWIVMDILWLTVFPMTAIWFLVHACEARQMLIGFVSALFTLWGISMLCGIAKTKPEYWR